MIEDIKEVEKDLEKLIYLIEKNIQEEGYITKRFSQTGGKFSTTSYDCLILRDENGKEYTLNIDERARFNRKNGRWEPTNDLVDESINAMKFFEFNDFGYYALIGAETEDRAIKHYEEDVSDIEDKDVYPLEISKEEAKKKLLTICKNEDEEEKAKREFNKFTLSSEPYLILIDGSLI